VGVASSQISACSRLSEAYYIADDQKQIFHTRIHTMSKNVITSLLSGLLLCLSWYGHALGSEDGGISALSVSVDNDRDVSIDVVSRDEAVLLSIRDASGIGSALLSPAHGKWPASIVFHIYTQGLESFSVSNSKLTSYTSVSTHYPPMILCEVRNAGNHERLSASDGRPYCMPTVIQAGGAGNSLPLRDGYFEVRLPHYMIKDNPSELVIRWVDFFRI
jgi:hypothetical protein